MAITPTVRSPATDVVPEPLWSYRYLLTDTPVNEDTLAGYIERTVGIVTALNPVIGYDAARRAIVGGRIHLQLWHVGRISHPALQPDGGQPVAPSAIRAMWSGVVPQQPPTTLRSPSRAHSCRNEAVFSGCSS